MSNAFLNREDQTQGRQEDLYQLLLQVMREEYPDDPRYQNGNTYVSDPTSPVRDNNNQELLNANELIKSSRNSQKVVKLNASQVTHTEYALDKKLPSIGIDDLDDLLDDEWQFYLDIPGLEKPRVDGLFLINLEINLNPPDFHHAYITRGPARIQERVDAGENLDDVIKSTFCVYFISNSAALPIPNYKTLEVMLVERGKTYNDIQEASIEQTKEFDLEIDGRFLADTDGTYDPFEEFKFRQMLDRSFSWNERVRFDSGYLPGYDDNTVQFERDPGDYLKPSSQQEDGLYFDIVYQKQTYREKLREKYEGKLIALQWALPYDSGSMTLQERANSLTAENTLVNDDKVFYVRMMINGYWKQVVSLNVLRQYCILNNLSLADFRLDRQEYGPDGNRLPKTTLVDPVFNQSGADAATYIYNGLYGVNGIMNLIAEQQGMEIINDYNITGQEVSRAYELLLAFFTNIAGASVDPDELSRSITAYLNEVKAPGWSDFGHIAEVNRLDTTEYEEYLNNYNNGGNPFEIDYLQPYEPPGSVKYYPSSQLVSLQQQAADQASVDTIKKQIQELLPSISARAADLELRFNAQPANYLQYVNSQLGPDSDIYKVLFSNDKFIMKKRKRSGKIIQKKTDKSFFKLCEIADRIYMPPSGLNIDEENKIFYKEGVRDFTRLVERGDSIMDKLANYTTDGDKGLLTPEWGTSIGDKTIGQTIASVGTAAVGATAGTVAALSVAAVLGATIFAPIAAVVGIAGAAAVGVAASIDVDLTPSGLPRRHGMPRNGVGIRQKRLLKRTNYVKLMIGTYIYREFVRASISGYTDDSGNSVDVFDEAQNIDVSFSGYRTTIDNAITLIKDIDERMLRSSSASEFQQIYDDLVNLETDFNNVDLGIFLRGEELKSNIDSFVKYMIKQQYDAVQYVRKKVNDQNSKYFITWPQSAKSTVNAYHPGKVFDNYQPDDADGDT